MKSCNSSNHSDSCKRYKNFYTTKIIVATVIMLALLKTEAQTIDPAFLRQQWAAEWISVPGTNPAAYGVYLFRKSFEMEVIPSSFPIFVSGDNRYKLYINEQLVSLGPARCDIEHWVYEMVDLMPYLKTGQNIIAAKIWNEGERKAEAQISFRTGFILQGANEDSKVLNTNNSWKCIRDSSYSIPRTVRVRGYAVVSPNEQIDMHLHIKGWDKLSYNDAHWHPAQRISRGTPKMTVEIDIGKTWRLVPSTLPQMEMTYQRFGKIRKEENISIPSTFPENKAKINIPANTKANFLLDQIHLTNAYPTIIFSAGNNSVITLSYAEALFDGMTKGNRNEIEGKTMIGFADILISDGSYEQSFTSLSYRTFRYINIEVETKESPLVIEDIYSTFTGFPFQLEAKLETDNTELQKILEIGWRTARLCAVDTYMDCPYYEQLQYIGDSRIQALVSLYNSGDDRLVKNLLTHADHSRQPEGITLSRYPTINPQIIPTFSMWYIGILYDYMMYGGDSKFIKDKLPGARQIMNYFKQFQEEDGSIKNLPNWTFADWADGWRRGMGPVGDDGYSAALDLQLLLAYQYAIKLEQNLGMNDYVALYEKQTEQLKLTIRKKYWDASRKLFADTSEKNKFSQHINSMAILAGLVTGQEAKEIGQKMLVDTELTNASIYFKYYLHLALIKAGLGNDYLNWLDDWRKNIELGLTTWAETSDVASARSDCHAWGSSPNIEFFRTILGIDSDAPNFKIVKIEPHLGSIRKIGGEMPHPDGKIFVHYEQNGNNLTADITLPLNITGSFIWAGKSYPLTAGKNHIKL